MHEALSFCTPNSRQCTLASDSAVATPTHIGKKTRVGRGTRVTLPRVIDQRKLGFHREQISSSLPYGGYLKAAERYDEMRGVASRIKYDIGEAAEVEQRCGKRHSCRRSKTCSTPFQKKLQIKGIRQERAFAIEPAANEDYSLQGRLCEQYQAGQRCTEKCEVAQR